MIHSGRDRKVEAFYNCQVLLGLAYFKLWLRGGLQKLSIQLFRRSESFDKKSWNYNLCPIYIFFLHCHRHKKVTALQKPFVKSSALSEISKNMLKRHPSRPCKAPWTFLPLNLDLNLKY